MLLSIVAVVVIAAMVALLSLVTPFERSGAGAEDVTPSEAGPAVIHDDAGNVNFVRRWRPPSAIVHDDAGNVHH